jgi:hypothetical protein
MLADTLLRAVVRATPQDDETTLAHNLQTVRDEIAVDDIDGHIFAFICDMFDRSRVVPSITLVLSHFTALRDRGDGTGMAAATRLEMFVALLPDLVSGADFRYELDNYKREVQERVLSVLLTETTEILTKGLDKDVRVAGAWKKINLKGPEAALNHLGASVGDIYARLRRGGLFEGSLKDDAARVLSQYEMRRNNPGLKYGVLSGIERIDQVHRGLKPGNLAFVLGFVSQMKSTFCLNWAYRAAIWQGMNVGVVSTEMSIDELRRTIAVIHANSAKFAPENLHVDITYDKVENGELDAQEEELFRKVIRDLEENSDYGQISYREPDNIVTIGDIGRWAEGVNRKTPLKMLLIDYVGPHITSDKPTNDSFRDGNNVIKDTKRLATTFDNGRGIAVLSPFQSNRGGFKDAVKNGGVYDITAMADFSEAERSADLVYTVFLDNTYRTRNRLLVGNVKTRKVQLITEAFEVVAFGATGVVEDEHMTNPRHTPISGLL